MLVTTHRPVVVHVTKFVSELLDVVGLKPCRVQNDIVMGGGDCSAPAHRLAAKVEVVPGGDKKWKWMAQKLKMTFIPIH